MVKADHAPLAAMPMEMPAVPAHISQLVDHALFSGRVKRAMMSLVPIGADVVVEHVLLDAQSLVKLGVATVGVEARQHLLLLLPVAFHALEQLLIMGLVVMLEVELLVEELLAAVQTHIIQPLEKQKET